MYKYFKELENPDEYKIYLLDNFGRKNRIISSRNLKIQNLSFEFLKENKELFNKLKELDKFILGHKKEFGYPLFMEGNKRWTLSELYYYSEELEEERLEQGLREAKCITNSDELIRKLDDYQVYCNYFMSLYPNLKVYFADISNSIQKALKEFVKRIELPPQNRIVTYSIPDAWFITPSGFLYNPDGEVGDLLKGHKEGNLRYSFERIEERFQSNVGIAEPYYDEKESYKERLRKIMKEDCVNELNFQMYANVIFDFNVVLTEKMLNEKKFSDYVIDMPEEEIKEIITRDKNIWVRIKNQEREKLMKLIKSLSEMKVSYQPNMNTLVQGYFAAVIDLYASFSRLNDSNHKKELLDKIYDCSWDIWEKYVNTLIRFSGFHKVESCERKITTSSLYGVEMFKAYLDKGWDLYIVPPIVYDAYIDDVNEMNFHSYYVEKHFDQVLSDYDGKGRVLVRDINC